MRAMLIKTGVHDARLSKLSAAGARLAKWIDTASNRQKQCLLKALIERIELCGSFFKLIIRLPELPRMLSWDRVGLFRPDSDASNRVHATEVVEVPATTICMKRELTLLLKRKTVNERAKPNAALIRLLTKARAAQAILDERSVWQVTELAAEVGCHPKRFTQLARLNYLAPDIVAAIRDGAQPAGLTCRALWSANLPMDWALQRRLLGFPDQADFLRAAPGW